MYCTSCGQLAAPSQRFCIHCGAALPDPAPPARQAGTGPASFPVDEPTTRLPALPPVRRRSTATSWLFPILGVIVAVAVAAGVTLFALRSRDSNKSPNAAAASSGPPSGVPTTVSPSARTTAPSTSTASPALPATPQDAARLDRRTAAKDLNVFVARDASRVSDLAGNWVPQVSSKCPGLSVDLGPDYNPDGQIDTPTVSTAQILAMHLAVQERYGALTTTPDALRSRTRPAVCRGQPMWVALVPTAYATSSGALRWCAGHNLPPQECGARWVAPPGSGTRFVGRG